MFKMKIDMSIEHETTDQYERFEEKPTWINVLNKNRPVYYKRKPVN